MTSTILSNKEFKPLFKWAFRRNRTILIIFSILLGLGMVLNVYAMAISGNYNDDAVPITLVFYEAGAAFFTFVSALKTFSFLHNKRSVDMFGALPTNRPTMFISHLLAGISAVALPFTIGSIIIMGMASRSGDTFKVGVFMILTTLLMIVASYTFTALIAYCCGTAIDTAIVTIAANGIWVGMIALYFGLLSEIIPGYSFENVAFSPILPALAPYGFSVADLLYYYESSTSAIIANIIYQLFFTAGIFFLTIYVCKSRKAESSQNGFAFSWLPMVIKAGASIVSGAFIGFIAAESAYSGYTNMYIFAFWYVIIGFAAFFVLHIIFSRGLKGKFIPQAIVFGSTTVAVLILVFSMTYGLGIDSYVPNPDTIKSVEFDYHTFQEPENIKLVTEIHQLVTEGVKDVNGYPYYIGGGDDYQRYGYDYSEQSNTVKQYSYVNSCDFNFDYKRKFGFSTHRNYYIYSKDYNSHYYDLEKLNNLISKLYQTEEYKKSEYPELFDDDYSKNLTVENAQINFKVYTSENFSSTTASYSQLPDNAAFYEGFMEAYKKDLLADNSYGDSNGSAVGQEIIEVYIYYTVKKRNVYGHYYNNFEREYLVKNNYKNTIDYLEKAGINKTTATMIDSYNPTIFDERFDYDGYINFGYSGDYTDLQAFIDDIAPNWAYSSCENAGIENYSKWHQDNYNDYLVALNMQANKLYDEYFDNPKYYNNPDYTNDYISTTGDGGGYFQLEDAIIAELKIYSDDYVIGTLPKDDDTASDSKTSSDSDIDSNTDSENQSKAKSYSKSTAQTEA